MIVEYDGSGFHGWQLQPGRSTVQGALERALATVLREAVRVEAAGRTDAGVHARGQVVAFSAGSPPPLERLQQAVNALCRPGIAVREIAEAAPDFDPRRDAASRTYEYRIRNRTAPSPFSRAFAWHVHQPLDFEAMRRAAACLVGEHDFGAFQAADCDAGHPVRRVLRSELRREGDDLVYEVTATAFLRHMVRNVVGTLVEVGRGERSVEAFASLLELRDRRRAGPTAPAHGLCLVRVDYDDVAGRLRPDGSAGPPPPPAR